MNGYQFFCFVKIDVKEMHKEILNLIATDTEKQSVEQL